MVFGPRRALLLVVAGLAAALVAGLVLAGLDGGARGGGRLGSGSRERPTSVTVQLAGSSRRVPFGFLGLSLEYSAVQAYAGKDPRALDPVFEALVRNLTPGQAPVLRIGGDSTDRTWWPTSRLERPPGIRFAITKRWLAVTRALAHALHARLILGLNLEADSPDLAAAEADALLAGIGPGTVRALELGNEPDLYASFPWYRTPDGYHVTGRPASYDMPALIGDFTRLAAVLPPHLLAGPSLGAPAWMRDLPTFLAAEPRVGVVTLHRYPLQLCFTARGSPRFPTLAHLLAPAASIGLADSFAPYARIAHARGLALRIDELNSVSCGADPAVSQTFASALWALDTLFAMVRAGVHGVNIHTFPGAGYELFRLRSVGGRWQGLIAPEYYGLMMFARAAPAGSRLLSTEAAPARPVQSWATQARDGTVRVLLINAGRRARVVSVDVGEGRYEPASLERLSAPSVRARSGVMLAGQQFAAPTFTGRLSGPLRTSSLAPVHGRYRIALPVASAALLVLARRGAAAG